MIRFECASVFSDHCVLQQNESIRVFGYAPVGAEVTATLLQEQQILTRGTCVAEEAEEGSLAYNFLVVLPGLKAGGPYDLSVTCGEENLLFRDVYVGEVWLAGGQSNMEFKLCQDREFEAAKQRAKTTNVRFFQVGQRAFVDEAFRDSERQDRWMLGAEEGVDSWSAVGYYFGEKIAAATGVMVGVIGCNWGGTSAGAWQDRQSLLSDDKTAIYWTEYEDIVSKQKPEEYEAERLDYLAYHAWWEPKVGEYYATHPNATWDEVQEVYGPCRWPGPMGPKHEFRPCGLYETMLRRVTPFALAGVIYYQGESDDHRPKVYETLLTKMIAVWRREFRQEKLPFMLVQLPMHRYRDNPITDSWCTIREAQMKVHKADEYTGLAVAIDCGEYNNIHPTRKTEVGKRLALQALYHLYHLIQEAEAYGPVFKGMKVDGDRITLEFTHAEGGFCIKEDKEAVIHMPSYGFEIAGEDGRWEAAEVVFDGDQIRLSSQKISFPTQARYLWTDYAGVEIFGKNGLPLAPFWAKETSKNEKEQENV